MNNYVYFIGDSLYMNITNRCSNDCDFCIRNHKNGMNGFSLWLDKEPTAEEVIKCLPDNLEKFKEAVFCGFGEPTYNMPAIVEVGKHLHGKGVKTRINTNGQANLINGKNVVGELVEACDEINVSLNECNAEKYDEHCKSVFGKVAFYEMLSFAKEAAARGGKVNFSIVDTIGEEDINLCKKLAEKLGVPLRIRKYE